MIIFFLLFLFFLHNSHFTGDSHLLDDGGGEASRTKGDPTGGMPRMKRAPQGGRPEQRGSQQGVPAAMCRSRQERGLFVELL